MKKIVCVVVVLGLVGCKSTDISMITDSMSDIAGIGAQTTSTTNSVYQQTTQQYSNKSEPFYITENTKMSPEYGVIRSIVHEKNPSGITMVRFVAYHQDSGAPLESRNYLYAQDSNGWLSDKAVPSFDSKAIVINSGDYYLKSEAITAGKFYTTGMIKLDKGVTNFVTIELQ